MQVRLLLQREREKERESARNISRFVLIGRGDICRFARVEQLDARARATTGYQLAASDAHVQEVLETCD